MTDQNEVASEKLPTLAVSDPRRYGVGDAIRNELAMLAASGDAQALRAAVLARLHADDDVGLRASMKAAGSRDAYLALFNAICSATERPEGDPALYTTLFAMPVVLVCGAKVPAEMPCVLPDTGELIQVLEKHGALGPNRNIGFGNGLCSAESVEAAGPSAVWRAMHGMGAAPEFPPAPIRLLRGAEEVHVRFLPGAAMCAPHAPSIVETGANIGIWGIPVTRLLGPALSPPQVQVLAVPRPPAALLRAGCLGRRAGLGLAFNLFLSNNVRMFRSRIGEPAMVVSAHDSGELRVTLSNVLDEDLTEGYAWPLHPADDIAEITREMLAIAGDCRLESLYAVERVMPDRTSTGALVWPGVRDATAEIRLVH